MEGDRDTVSSPPTGVSFELKMGIGKLFVPCLLHGLIFSQYDCPAFLIPSPKGIPVDSCEEKFISFLTCFMSLFSPRLPPSPQTPILRPPPQPLSDVRFGKLPFENMSGDLEKIPDLSLGRGTWKNFELLYRDLEKFQPSP